MSTSNASADVSPAVDAASGLIGPSEHVDTGEVVLGQGGRCETGDVTAEAVGFDGGLLARYEHAAVPQAPATPGPDLLEILQTLVATTHGYDADLVRLDPDQFEWAERNGYPLIIIRHPDGGVTLTKFHTRHCAFVTSAGIAECDCG
jgi:hypothetical protein